MSENETPSPYAKLSMEQFITNEFTKIEPPEYVEYSFTISDFPNNDDEYWMEKALDYSPVAYLFLSDRLKLKPEFVQKAIEDQGSLAEKIVQYLPKTLLDDENIMIMAVRETTKCFEFASERLRDNQQFVMDCLDSVPMNEDSSFMYYISDRLLDMENIITQGITKFSSAYAYASPRLRTNLNFACDCLSIDNYYHGRKEIGSYMNASIRKQMGYLLED